MSRVKLFLFGKVVIENRGRGGWGDGVSDLFLDLKLDLGISNYHIQQQLREYSNIPFQSIRNHGYKKLIITIYKKTDVADIELYAYTGTTPYPFKLTHNLHGNNRAYGNLVNQLRKR